MTDSMVTLWCEAGQHNWQRVSQRGRRPFHCPEHKPDTPTNGNGSGRTREQAQEDMRREREQRVAETLSWERENVYPHVKDTDGNYDSGALRILEDCDKLLFSDWRPTVPYQKPDGDWVNVRISYESEDLDQKAQVRDRILKRAREAVNRQIAEA